MFKARQNSDSVVRALPDLVVSETEFRN